MATRAATAARLADATQGTETAMRQIADALGIEVPPRVSIPTRHPDAKAAHHAERVAAFLGAVAAKVAKPPAANAGATDAGGGQDTPREPDAPQRPADSQEGAAGEVSFPGTEIPRHAGTVPRPPHKPKGGK